MSLVLVVAPAVKTRRRSSPTAGLADAAVPGPLFEDLKPNEYAFYVVPGDRDKVSIEFEGGGSCQRRTSTTPRRAARS